MPEHSNADIGHALNNALTAIGGFADILRHNALDDSTRDWALDGLDDAVKRAFELAGRLHTTLGGEHCPSG